MNLCFLRLTAITVDQLRSTTESLKCLHGGLFDDTASPDGQGSPLVGEVVQLDHVGKLLLSSNNFNEKKLLREVERLISRLEKILTSFVKVEVSELNRVSHFPVDICPPITFSLKSFIL